jgi:hypothetical protein
LTREWPTLLTPFFSCILQFEFGPIWANGMTGFRTALYATLRLLYRVKPMFPRYPDFSKSGVR